MIRLPILGYYAPVGCFLVLVLAASTVYANEPPTVSITGVLQGEEIPYRSTIGWTGADRDGTIDYFEYALDPPDAFTPEEIANPESAPGVTIDVVGGPGADQDTLRVSKVVSVDTVTFDYVQTPAISMDFVFSTPNADSTYNPGLGRLEPAPSFLGDHTLYVRALDNEGSHGLPDHVGFTSSTITPSATIRRPRIEGLDYLTVGPSLRIEWDGVDPDGPDPVPAGYFIKLLRLDTLVPPITFFQATPAHLFTHGGAWEYRDGHPGAIDLNLIVRGSYLFGVRAVDENGAVEPFLEFGRNAFMFQVFANAGFPVLELHEPFITGPSGFSFVGIGESRSASAPANVDLRFFVSCNADWYGGICAGFRWGLDLPNPDTEDGWSPWTQATDQVPPFSFQDTSVHNLYVEIRDDVGQVTRGHVILTVLGLPFDRAVLYVDDYKDSTWPRDELPMISAATGDTLAPSHDGFWRSLFQGYGKIPLSSFYEFHASGHQDAEFTLPIAPTLEELGRYKLVIWNTLGSGYDGYTALSASVPTVVRDYLLAGGNLWISGRMTVGAMSEGGPGRGEFTYPKDLTNGSQFASECLKLWTSRLDNDKGLDHDDTFVMAQPSASIPAMSLDTSKLNPPLAAARGVGHCDAVFDPLFHVNGIEELYTYGAYGPLVRGRSSSYNGKLCAIRWHDPEAPPNFGKVMWFGFPMYYFKDAEAQATFNWALDWFLGLEAVPVALSSFTVHSESNGAVLTWAVAAAHDHAGFHVYRELPGEGRVRISQTLLSGRDNYTFRDVEAPRSGADYWLAELSRAGETSWHGPVRLAAEGSARWLLAASPNPFASETRIRYSIDASGPVRITVIDVRGRFVVALTDGIQEPGQHEVAWDGRLTSGEPARSGLYFIRSEIGGERRALKVILNR